MARVKRDQKRLAEREAKDIERKARRAWTQKFGRGAAKRLEPFASYGILFVDGETWVYSDSSAVEEADEIRRTTAIPRGRDDVPCVGYKLGARVNRVDRIDPPLTELHELINRRAAEAREREAERRRAAAESVARRREIETFRVPVTSLPN
jgi:hypothetical protein